MSRGTVGYLMLTVLGEILARVQPVPAGFFFGGSMRAMPHRGKPHKGRSARSFRHNVGKSHPFNVKMAPRRGGWRL